MIEGTQKIETPKPNWNISFGEEAGCFNICAYIVDPPNAFQRWVLRKFFGMEWREL